MKNVALKTQRVIPLYGGILWLIVAKNAPQAYRDEIDRIGVGLYAKAPKEFRARCAGNKRGIFALFFHRNLRHSEIAHECGHFVLDVLAQVQVKIDSDNSEPLTYFLDDTVDWVYRQLKKAKIRVSI